MFVSQLSKWRPTSSCEEALNSGKRYLEIGQWEDLTAGIGEQIGGRELAQVKICKRREVLYVVQLYEEILSPESQ